MKHISLTLSLFAVTAANAGNFMGFSEIKTDGDAGFLGMNAYCELAYGYSKFCSTKDIVLSTYLIKYSGEIAWVRPEIVGVTPSGPDNSQVNITDYTGKYGPASHFSCNGWNSMDADVAGITVRGDTFGFAQATCNVQLKVACCEASESYRIGPH